MRLPKEIKLRRHYLVKPINKIKTFYAPKKILSNLEDLEDLYLVDKGMKAVKSGKVKAIPIDQVERNLKHIYK